MNNLLDRSREIWEMARAKVEPVYTIALISGGNDSKSAYYAARELGISVDALLFTDTRTGIPETRRHVVQWAETTGVPLIIADAGLTYENYVLRKGFFGRGREAHNFAYHMLKADHFRKAISKIRQRRRGFRVAMITGIRLNESDNRKYWYADRTIAQDKNLPNYFVNLIEHWSKRDTLDCIGERRALRNPVADILHKSGECWCGATQTEEERQEAERWFPEWGCWLRELNARVRALFPWSWGEEMPAWLKQVRAGQMTMGDEFMLCQACEARSIAAGK